jgi:hypothetical protein
MNITKKALKRACIKRASGLYLTQELPNYYEDLTQEQFKIYIIKNICEDFEGLNIDTIIDQINLTAQIMYKTVLEYNL